jgi:predicted transposase/invertase (TIGR01784 family)
MNRIRFGLAEDLSDIDIRRDNVFKSVFTRNTPQSRGALSRLLSADIGRRVEVIGIAANEPPPEGLGERQIRFDVNCMLDQGELANIEMCLYPNKYEPLRSEYHVGKLHTSQEIRGAKRTFQNLNHTYHVSLHANRTYFADEYFIHQFEYYDPERQVRLEGRCHIVIVELEKLEAVVRKPVKEMDAAERWAVFIRYMADMEKRRIINELLEEEEGIGMAGEVLMTISKDQEERMRLVSEYMAAATAEANIYDAREEGRQEERYENAFNLLKVGVNAEQIAKALNMPLDTVLVLEKDAGCRM